MTSLFALLELGPVQIILLLVVGVLLFGRRLPEIGRYLGRGIVEFKKGMHGLEDELTTGTSGMNPMSPMTRSEPTQAPAPEQIRPPQRVATTAPKFEDTPNSVTPPPRIQA